MKKFLAVILTGILLAGCGQTAEDENPPAEDKPQDEAQAAEETLESLGASADIHQSGKAVMFDMELANNGSEDAELTYTSGQQYEIVVTNEENEEVYRYSKDQAFTEAIEEKTLQAGESMTWHEEWTPQDAKSGTYEATITLMPAKVNGEEVSEKTFEISKTFEIEEQGTAFKNLQVEGDEGKYSITGEARVFEGVFFYSVEEGHEYLVEETKVDVKQGAPNWSPFTIELDIPKEDLPVNGTVTLVLYEKSAKDGQPTNVTTIKVDDIQKDLN
ncbi:BsuPI-related putative proteinase inhibitor [Bacillus tianshenii]|nr:BsuPI-related putative proteinase inhibitor [Bacillus tianshenii]